MGIFGGGEVIRAFIQDEHAGAVSVVGGQIVFGHGYGDGFAFAGIQQLGLAIAHQLHGGLFDLVLLVVFGVGFLGVHLHGLLARRAAGVGHVHGQGVGGFLVFAALFHLHIGKAEGRIAQAIAEGEGNHAAVIEVSRVGRSHDHVFIPGLSVLVAHVDAFLIHHVLAVGGQGLEVVLVGVGVGIGAEVVHHGIQLVVHPPGIRQGAGGIHRAGEHVAHGVQAGLAHGAHPQSGVHAIVFFKQEGGADGVGAVDDDGDGADSPVVLHFLQAFQDGTLVLVEGQVILNAAVQFQGVFLFGGDVVAFAAHAAHDVDHVFALADRVVVILADFLPAHFADFIGVALGFVFHIIIQQGLVHHRVTRAGQHVVIIRRTVRVHSAGTCAAVDGVHHRDAHQAYLTARGQGQGAVIVL